MGLSLGAVLALLGAVVMVTGDVYLHVPRGSNNRLDEKSQNRAQNNRVFDSQNNNKGGYNVGDRGRNPAQQGNRRTKAARQFQMSHFMSATNDAASTGGNSYFPIEWTAQHGCGENTPGKPSKNNCNMVLQYMCQPDTGALNDRVLRDGTSTNRNNFQRPRRRETEQQFLARAAGASRTDRGMNEPYAWYDKCRMRRRNKGLFTADQNVNADRATNTRQNPNGNRNGYECAEERDYYPYWHPSDWKDIAVLTEDESLCNYYKSESFNTKPKHECRQTFRNSAVHSHLSRANTEAECNAVGGQWTEVHNYLEKVPNLNEQQCIAQGHVFGHALYGRGNKECLVKVPPVDCQKAPYTRVNHLGNSENLTASKYMWKLPNFPSGQAQRCVLRTRYNISTDDYDPWKTDSKSNNNDNVIENNPNVNVGLPNGQTLQLALNTAQTGRTFQDRSHVFKIQARTAAMGQKNIHMLTVRGKRGNIVQTFPGVEYDFVPNNLEIKQDDLVHIEWTGSNTGQNQGKGDGQPGDDGEGKGGSDRSNILPMTDRANNFFMTMEDDRSMFKSMQAVWAAKPSRGGLSQEDIAVQLSTSGQFRDKAELQRNIRNWQNQLNNAPASFPGMVVRFTKSGTHNYGCTRNNNFSNRSQKGTIIVE